MVWYNPNLRIGYERLWNICRIFTTCCFDFCESINLASLNKLLQCNIIQLLYINLTITDFWVLTKNVNDIILISWIQRYCVVHPNILTIVTLFVGLYLKSECTIIVWINCQSTLYFVKTRVTGIKIIQRIAWSNLNILCVILNSVVFVNIITNT